MDNEREFPTRMEHFEHIPVTVYEFNGTAWISGDDIGICLGLVEPARAIRKIFARHKDELEPYTWSTKLVRQGDTQARPHRLYDDQGAYLITMFARTPKAKQVRAWLVTLPNRVRAMSDAARRPFEYAQAQAALPSPEAVHTAREQGLRHGLLLSQLLQKYSMDMADLARWCYYRHLGLTQKDTAKVFDFLRPKAQSLETDLKEVGITLPWNRASTTRDQMIFEYLEHLLGLRPMPSLCLPCATEVDYA